MALGIGTKILHDLELTGLGDHVVWVVISLYSYIPRGNAGLSCWIYFAAVARLLCQTCICAPPKFRGCAMILCIWRGKRCPLQHRNFLMVICDFK